MRRRPPQFQLFRVSSEKEIHSTGGDAEPERFLTDVQYVSHYAASFAECLGVRGVMYALIDDTNSKTGFYYAPARKGNGWVANGVMSQSPLLPEELLDELFADQKPPSLE